MSLTITNEIERVLITYDDGNRRTYSKNDFIPYLDNGNFYLTSKNSGRIFSITNDINDVTGIIDNEAGTTPDVPETIAELYDLVNAFFFRGHGYSLS